MNKIVQLFLFILIISILSGCSFKSQPLALRVRYQSEPSGAILYCKGKKLGYTPQDVKYIVSKNDKKRGYIIIKDCKAMWISGAVKKFNRLRLNLKKDKMSIKIKDKIPSYLTGWAAVGYRMREESYLDNKLYIFIRPKFPNLEKDEHQK